MHETARDGGRLAHDIRALLDAAWLRNVTVVVAPPFTALGAVGNALAGSGVALGAQNMHWEDAGAFTGEIAPPMLVELGVHYVILGHSERRRYFGESDDDVRRKVHAALEHGLRPIIAVGETEAQRDAGETDACVTRQTRAALDGVERDRRESVAIAYEPVWAIGTGRNCELQEADRVMSLIKGSTSGLEDVPVLYGGSANPSNFAAYLALQSCRGGLIGGASLDAQAFATMVRLGAEARA